ncbi:hypothetical protein [Saccharothrix sp. Mg75]|uniref:hypothetical protein n=1 Tax=Saccharothrix sp. Mg75 TaxID=3445357 RepID=UPI003EE8A84C
MTDFDLARIVADVAGSNPAALVRPGSPEAAAVPPRWRAVASGTDAAARCSAALALWNQDFLDLLPSFAAVFRERLADVRACRLRDDWVLLYLARDAVDPHVVVWIGWDPAAGGDARPEFWDSLPEPARRFLTDVHAGFTGPDWESHGLVGPARMTTFAEWFDLDEEAVEDWDEDAEVAAGRMAVVTTNGSTLYYCVSPDVPPGRVVLVHEDDVDAEPEFGEALDQLMSRRFSA